MFLRREFLYLGMNSGILNRISPFSDLQDAGQFIAAELYIQVFVPGFER